MTKLIILDRDGVINFDSVNYVKSPEEWHAIPGSLDAIVKLNKAGYKVVVATNQSGIARGLYDHAMLNLIHEKMHTQLHELGGCIDDIFFCDHHPNDQCECRKPKPGMFHAIKAKYHINLEDVFFIGDSATDMQVANHAPIKPILVLTSKGEATLRNNPDFSTLPYFENLAKAVEYVLSSDQDKL